MSTEPKDTSTSAEGIVRSGVAAAFEDGVDSYGEVPPTTDNNQPLYSFNKPPLRSDVIEASSEMSPEINPTRIQNIASLTIAPDEIEKIKEALDAKSLEDLIELGIIHKIIETIESSDELNEIWLSVKQKHLDGLIEGQDMFANLAEIIVMIDRLERALCKGNMYKACNEDLKGFHPSLSTYYSLYHDYFFGRNFNPHWYSSRFLAAPEQGGFGNFDMLERVSIASDVPKSILGGKTISTVLAQCFYDAETKIDYGISPRLMALLLGKTRVEEEDIQYGGDSTNIDYPSRIVSCNKWKGSYDDHPFFPSLKSLFRGQGHAYSNPAAIGTIGTTWAGTSFQLINPLNHCLPEVLKNMNPCAQLTYLGEVIASEFKLSAALGAEIANQEGCFTPDGGFSAFGNWVDTKKPFYEHRRLSSQLGRTLINAASFGSRPVPEGPSTGTGFGSIGSLLFGACVGGSGAPEPFNVRPIQPGFMPFEISTTEQDEIDGKNRVGRYHSWRSGIFDRYKNIGTASDISAEVESINSDLSHVTSAMKACGSYKFLSNLGRGAVFHGGTAANTEKNPASEAHVEGSYIAARVIEKVTNFASYRNTVNPGHKQIMLSLLAGFMGSKSNKSQPKELLRKTFFKRICLREMSLFSGAHHSVRQNTRTLQNLYGVNQLEFSQYPGLQWSTTWIDDVRSLVTTAYSMHNGVLGEEALTRERDDFGGGGLTSNSSIDEIVKTFQAMSTIAYRSETSDEAEAVCKALYILHSNLRRAADDSSMHQDLDNAIETTSERTGIDVSCGGYAGFAGEDDGEVLLEMIFGRDMQAQSLMDDIIDTAHEIEVNAINLMRKNSHIDNQSLVPFYVRNGITSANGMDKGQLLGMVFEMYCIAAEMLYDVNIGHHTPRFNEVNQEIDFGSELTNTQLSRIAMYFDRNPDDFRAKFYVADPMNFRSDATFKYRIVPKYFNAFGALKTSGEPRSGTPVFGLNEYNRVMHKLVRPITEGPSATHNVLGRRYSGTSKIRDYVTYALSNWSNGNEKTEDQIEDFLEATGLQNSSGFISKHREQRVTIEHFIHMMADANSDTGYVNETLGPALAMVDHLYSNLLKGQGAPGRDLIQEEADFTDILKSEAIEQFFNDPDLDVPPDFLTNQSVRMMKQMRASYKDILESTGIGSFSAHTFGNRNIKDSSRTPAGKAGYNVYKQNPSLDRAAKMYLDSLSTDKTHNIFFFGIPPGLIDSHLISLVADDHTRPLTVETSLSIKISANKRSEFAEEIRFTNTSAPREYSSGLYMHESYIEAAMIGYSQYEAGNDATEGPTVEIPTNFQQLVNRINFGVMQSDDRYGTTSQKTDITSISGEALIAADSRNEARCRQVLESFLLKYIFRRLTRLQIDERYLSTTPGSRVNMGAVSKIMNDLVHPALNIIREQHETWNWNAPESGIVDSVDKAIEALESTFNIAEFDIDSIKKLFASEDGNTSGASADDTDNFMLETNQDKLKSLLQPQPKNRWDETGRIVVMENPKINKLEQIMTELFTHLNAAQGANVTKQQFLAPKMFDTIIGVNFSNLSNDFIVEETSVPDSYSENIDTNNLGGPDSTSTKAAVITDALNGIVTVDNFTFNIQTSLD